MSEDRQLLQMKHIRKSFPGVLVLDDVNFSVGYGEIHALMGENGAGKSTLIKILTGIHAADSGSIYVDGKEVKIKNKHDAAAAGISVIYQELSLITTLSVMENIFLGQELTKGKLFLNKRAMRKRAQELVDRCGFDIDLDIPVENLSVAKQQTVEILKAILYDAKLIIMDEPTASLNIQESEALFKIIRQLKEQGTSIIYISHRLEEVQNLSDRLTILRDGKVKGVMKRGEIDMAEVVHMMIGKELKEEAAERHEVKSGASVLKVEGLSTPELLDQISFEAYGGQMVMTTVAMNYTVGGTLLGIALGILVGMLCGLVNGAVSYYFAIPSFIVTLAMKNIVLGIAQYVTGHNTIICLESKLVNWIGTGKILGIPFLIWFFVIVFAITWFVLNRTKFGKYTYATGGNEVASRYSGINSRMVGISAFVISGLTAALSGILLSCFNRQAIASQASGYDGNVLVILVVGGISMAGGEGNIVGTLFGMLLIGIINNAMLLIGIDSIYQDMVQGLLIVAAIAIDTYSKKKKLQVKGKRPAAVQ